MRLDQDELALRMLEAAIGFRRPRNLTAAEALHCAPQDLTLRYRHAAVAAIQYFIECAGPLTILPEPVQVVDPDRNTIKTVLVERKNGGA